MIHVILRYIPNERDRFLILRASITFLGKIDKVKHQKFVMSFEITNKSDRQAARMAHEVDFQLHQKSLQNVRKFVFHNTLGDPVLACRAPMKVSYTCFSLPIHLCQLPGRDQHSRDLVINQGQLYSPNYPNMLKPTLWRMCCDPSL